MSIQPLRTQLLKVQNSLSHVQPQKFAKLRANTVNLLNSLSDTNREGSNLGCYSILSVSNNIIAQQNNPPSGTNGGGSNLGNYSKLSVDTNTGSTKNPPSDTNGGGSNLDWYCNPISTQWFSSVQ